jgi:hypothetical protein
VGMFDNVRVLYPLPKPETGPLPPEDTTFQTKDMECLLDEYTIHEDGRLTVRRCEYEDTGEIDPLLKMRIHRVVREWDEQVPHHGDIEFYHWVRWNEDSSQWWSYTARFTDGVLSRITLNEYEGPFVD